MEFENVEDVYALSPIQEGMLFHTISAPTSGVFVEQVCFTIRGSVDIDNFQSAWNDLVARHAVLRTIFLWDGLDEPLQVVRQKVDIPWNIWDWRDQSALQQEQRLADFLSSDRNQGFDLAHAPLLRLTLIQQADDRWRFVWSCHHLLADGWSAVLLLKELFSIYAAGSEGESLEFENRLPYKHYIEFLQNRTLDEAELFWRDQLADFSSSTRLFDFTRQSLAGGHKRRNQLLPRDLSDQLRSFAREYRLTLNTVVVGAWALLLSNYSNEEDVVFGTTVAGRSSDLPGIESAIGLFMNTLPLRVQLSQSHLVDWLREIQDRQIAIRQFDHSPLADIQRWSDIPRGESLFESIVVFESSPEPLNHELATVGLDVDEFDVLDQSNYALALLVMPGDGLELRLVHNAEEFSTAFACQLLRHLQQLLASFVATPNLRLAEYSLLTEDEQQKVLDHWNDTSCDFETERTIHHLIEAQAESQPTATAVVYESTSLTYKELNRRGNHLAAQLQAAGVGPNDHVGLFANRSLEMAIGLLGILKAGAAYVPLDPTYPTPHLESIVEDAQLATIVTQRHLSTALPAGASAVVVASATDTLPAEVVRESAGNIDATAYIIYTSGSSGKPKGVPVTHRNLVNSTLARRHFYRERVDRFLLVSSFAFDSSIAGIFWTLVDGGTLILPSLRLEQDTHRLLQLLSSQRVSHFLCLPSLYALLLQDTTPGQLERLKTVIVAGEACSSSIVREHYSQVPQSRLYNEYGPTEATVWCTASELTPEHSTEPIPIGRPIANTQVYVLDRRHQPVPIGACGELYVAGRGLTKGYLHQPGLTKSKFLPNPYSRERGATMYATGDLAYFQPNGQLVFAGRADNQVKIRGYRIELQEIEEVLSQHPAISDAFVAAEALPTRTTQSADTTQDVAVGESDRKQLCGYVVTSEHWPGFDAQEIRKYLGERLPDYMVPDHLTLLDALPRLPNGKVDIYKLAAVREAEPHQTEQVVPPRSEMEETLASIWSELLNLDAVSVHDNFYEIGGDSIVSIQVISRARSAGLDIQPQQFNDNPTIAQLAAVASEATQPTDRGPIAGELLLTPFQHWFFELELSAPYHWNQSALFDVPQEFESDTIRKALDICVRHHDALRTRFDRRQEGWQPLVDNAEDAAVALTVCKLPSCPASEVASMLRSRIAESKASLDIQNGPLFQVMLLESDAGGPRVLLLSAHRLIIDPTSWFVLLDDLENLFTQLLAGKNARLPAMTSSVRDWTVSLIDHIRSGSLNHELDFWLMPQPPGCAELPRDNVAASGVGIGAVDEHLSDTVTVLLDAAMTGRLMTNVHTAYQTKPVEVLLTAVAQAFHRWTGNGAIRLRLEGHGRDLSLPTIDLSRTVGPFTICFPVTMQLSNPKDSRNSLTEIKEQFRAIPNDGIGYGLLRYFNDDQTVVEKLQSLPTPNVQFNYLGRISETNFRGQLSRHYFSELTSELISRGPDNRRSSLLEINAMIVQDQLRVDWTYRKNVHTRSTVDTLANDFLTDLTILIDHCVTADSGSFTPSDFPEAGLSQDELDRFLDEY